MVDKTTDNTLHEISVPCPECLAHRMWGDGGDYYCAQCNSTGTIQKNLNESELEQLAAEMFTQDDRIEMLKEMGIIDTDDKKPLRCPFAKR